MTSAPFYYLPPLTHWDNTIKGDVTFAGVTENGPGVNTGIWQELNISG
jgi:hypothetical protein